MEGEEAHRNYASRAGVRSPILFGNSGGVDRNHPETLADRVQLQKTFKCGRCVALHANSLFADCRLMMSICLSPPLNI